MAPWQRWFSERGFVSRYVRHRSLSCNRHGTDASFAWLSGAICKHRRFLDFSHAQFSAAASQLVALLRKSQLIFTNWNTIWRAYRPTRCLETTSYDPSQKFSMVCNSSFNHRYIEAQLGIRWRYKSLYNIRIFHDFWSLDMNIAGPPCTYRR